MKRTCLAVAASLALASTFGCARVDPDRKSSDIAATVGERKITVAEIDAAIQSDLARIEGEKYEARKGKLDDLIDETLLADHAKSLGITSAELVQREITAKVAVPTDEQIKATYEKFKTQVGPFEQVQGRIRDLLSSQATAARRAAFLGELRTQAKVEIRLDPPRITVDTATGHVQGPADAPITLIEFSDYQCPYCGRSQPTVDQVLAKYPGKVRHVFMDHPLTQIHPQALPAAVASRCAEEQGKFWEYHKLLFEHQDGLSADNFKKWASDLTLDGTKFAECLDAKKFDAPIQQSLEVGKAVGVNGTPGFFVNGIAIHGAQPVEVFTRVIDDELARKK